MLGIYLPRRLMIVMQMETWTTSDQCSEPHVEDVGPPTPPRLRIFLLIGLCSFLIMHPGAAEPRDLEKSMVINNEIWDANVFLSSNS